MFRLRSSASKAHHLGLCFRVEKVLCDFSSGFRAREPLTLAICISLGKVHQSASSSTLGPPERLLPLNSTESLRNTLNFIPRSFAIPGVLALQRTKTWERSSLVTRHPIFLIPCSLRGGNEQTGNQETRIREKGWSRTLQWSIDNPGTAQKSGNVVNH
ncbi:hypothetical protein TNCV_3656541 [Trichonephila clavipes]|nr:hypothetical protein TNCV_3656541 [Trichonephila clavipes]